VACLADTVAGLSRGARASAAQVASLGDRVAGLQVAASAGKAQAATLAGEQAAAAEQAAQHLVLSKALQSASLQLARELEAERRARRRLEAQVAALHSEVSEQREALAGLTAASGSAAAQLAGLTAAAAESKDAVDHLATGRRQLAKQLAKQLAAGQQLDADLRETQQAVAKELAGLRRHIKLVRGRAAVLRFWLACSTGVPGAFCRCPAPALTAAAAAAWRDCRRPRRPASRHRHTE
jgi:chromosome segregation ATPase